MPTEAPIHSPKHPGPNGRLHGFLIVDKPAGWTSHDVVGRARRLLGERKIGHAGTLDPAATGVLPLAVGTATRVLEYLAGASKTYVAEVTFGVETDSADADGAVIGVSDPSGVDRAGIETALASLRGPQDQIPPMHSAVKIAGRRLYDLARIGETIERAPRRVEFFVLELLDWTPPVARVLVDCSKGTYVRVLAQDLGTRLGAGAHLSDLVRTRTGPFTLCQAITVADLAEMDVDAVWPEIAFHPDAVLGSWGALLLDDAGAAVWRAGNVLPDPDAATAGPVRVYDQTGTWLGVGRATDDRGGWRPTKSVPSPVGSAA